MALPYELSIGLRYTRAKKHNHFISFISLISMVGIALGVAALIVVLSVMNGFQTELRSRILAVVSHVQITGADGEISGWQAVAADAATQPNVLAAAPYVQAQGMLAYGQAVRGAMVRGILPDQEDKVADFRPHIKSGQLDALQPDSFNIILGSELARALGVFVGDRVTLIAPQGVVTPAGVVPRLKTFTVAGIFEVGMFEYDSGLALIRLEDAQLLYRLDDRVSGVRLKLDDLFKAPAVARALAGTLRTDAYISDWTRSHANFFRAVQIEKNMMFIILSLIIAVAAFNIVSTLVMAVTDKQSDIAILRTLGASPGSIMAVFIVQGALIGFIGLGLGIAGGVTLALNVDVVVPFIERMLGTQFLSKEVYYISNLPSELQWGDVTTITGVAFVLALVATIYPSWRAARVNPAAALRYE
ncbi:MAG TPA: lipoprotein-releasing ABC transporter permease subunit [Accumulibacter sp.]|nr:lipoprotein-releasing ABC transporter permease subunit [Accumulibacter sp.]HMW17635.1 lipoprotein-releasing ABC transporter permease subunit [Accumulibacter sp.]HMX21731.1 lipoprotein-releasing ABC transporter permease subunit [Accumulibacter sp.]HMY05501.1 lipoprotein-releasing ABC transporter permease subunit [Accumulibacter sp.]HNC18294.1 lipoprotein-releasing ABC transporter permease subunit [Accumulibacter sp.]